MNDIIKHVTELSADLSRRTTDLSKAIDRALREAEERDKTRDFESGERYAYAPDSEKQRVRERIKAEQHRRAQTAAWHVGDRIRALAPELQRAIAAAQEPEGALAGYRRLHPSDKATAAEIDIREELKIARLERQLTEAAPSQWLLAYMTGDDTAVRYIEERHRFGRAGRLPVRADRATLAAEAQASQELSRAIAETRDRRVPRELREAEGALREGHRQMQQAKDLHAVEPVPPHLVR